LTATITLQHQTNIIDLTIAFI